MGNFPKIIILIKRGRSCSGAKLVYHLCSHAFLVFGLVGVPTYTRRSASLSNLLKLLQICTVEDLLPMVGNVGVSVGAGLLFGLITMLVQHVGLFVLGFHTGLLGGIAGIVISRLLGQTPDSMWVCIGVFMASGIAGSMANLYFQKGMTTSGLIALIQYVLNKIPVYSKQL